MGLLKVGKPLDWKDSLAHCNYIRRHGILQFINIYKKLHEIDNDRLFYGDEIEYALLKVDAAAKKVRISLRGPEVMMALRAREQDVHMMRGCAWHQEYGSWMLESTPSLPYGGYTTSLVSVEENMRLRRGRLLTALKDDEIAPTMVAFPLLGVGDFVHPAAPPGGQASESDYISDTCINPHPRFAALTGNIRQRRGSKVDIRIPLFKDAKTPEFESDSDPTIRMDCMAFGMGCCCLQVTFQASDIDESRYLHDQLAVLTPIMMALTAATPILKGRLAGTDARWKVISSSVDDRTPAERGEGDFPPDQRMAGSGVRRQSKSRYDSISGYIHPASHSADTVNYNDVPCEVDEEMRELLLKEGIDEAMARHIAHLFTRDPLVAFEGHIELDDHALTDHFESIQSTNWQTVRWKPPPVPSGDSSPHIGWRTEFRSMEVQLTDFENAAFTAFIVLVTRAILVLNLSLLAPLSMVDDNMERAHALDAVRTQKFWFRKHILPDDTEELMSQLCPEETKKSSALFEEMTMGEIMNGKSCYFPGLVPLCYAYLEHIGCDGVSYKHLSKYLSFISKRANGELMTPASWMRKFVRSHSDYKMDSVVTDSIAHDLVQACSEIGLGKRPCPEVLGNIKIEPIRKEGNYEAPLVSSAMDSAPRRELLKRYLQRAADCDGLFSTPTCSRQRSDSGAASPGASKPASPSASRRTSEVDVPPSIKAFRIVMEEKELASGGYS
eukprot:TRINITY_DN29664_c0_g1_i1.p1 TRINITY_DN29664_c0_g1~~TRINITY_DN29664_c0_g1_i1.p1  ORF type:complete len:746 (+),score=151.03 TRINITY_DN29664_c0_g1_i1:66-2240(+)